MFKRLKQFFSKKKESDDDLLKNLSELFINSPGEAIIQAQIYLMSPNFTNYDEFIDDVKKTQKSNCCIVSWSKSMLSARCLDCQKDTNSCICIPCYLAGKHDQHHSYISSGSGGGNCDCGDPNFWKPEGNCPNHPGPDPNPEITQMTSENRKKFIDIFKIAYHAAFMTDNDAYFIQIIEWITNFISFGDGLRRCVAIAVASEAEKFYSKLLKLEKEPSQILIDMFGKLTSDHHFGRIMGKHTVENYLTLRNIIQSYLMSNFEEDSIPFYPLKNYLTFSFHFFNEGTIMFMINECKFDWVSFVLSAIKYVFDTLKVINMDYKKNMSGQITSQLWYLSKMISFLMKKDEQHNNIQKFIDRYSSLLVNYEAFFHFTCPMSPIDESDNPFIILYLYINLYQINCIFSPQNQEEVSPLNKTFSIEATFSNLLKFLRSQKNLKPESPYAANDVPVSSFLPLHHLFYCLLSSNKNSIEKLSALFKKQKISMQDFCCLSSIYPLRFLGAIFSPERYNMLNKSTRRQITYCFDFPDDTFNIFFGHVQTMFNISPDKEQFLSAITETFGVFDEENSSSVFDASVFIISLLTDNSISTFNKVLFKRLRVIELLMNSKPTTKDIENRINDTLSNPIYSDDLQSFAERVSTSNGSFFRLKDDQNEFTPFFPMIFRKKRIDILMKYNDKLVPIPEYNKNSTLISCFNSQTFLALMFNCLISKQTIFNQVGLAMFVLAARNGPKYDFQNITENQETVIFDSFTDLVQQFKNKEKEKNFNPFLLKIKSNESYVQRSIIEVVQSLKRIGAEAFEKTDLPDFLRPKMAEDEDEIQRKKKARAANLKRALLNEFQNKRSEFTFGGPSSTKPGKTNKNDDDDILDDDDNDDDGMNRITMMSQSEDLADASEIMCNICQTKVKDDILGFPCLSLPCIFPSLINSKLHNLGIEIDELECVFSMSICMHHVHQKCCTNLLKEYTNDSGTRNTSHTYKCMIDRGPRNCFLPLFPDAIEFTTETSEELTEAVQSFMKEAFNGQIVNDQTIPIKSYAGAVLTIEVRHRSRPECLDNPAVSSLLRNMLHTFYAALHTNIEVDEKTLSDPLEKLVLKLINSDSPREEHKEFVKQISVSLKDDGYLYEFLRRAAIIEDFALKCEKEKSAEQKFIDWDEILSFENLIERYEIEKKDIENMIELPLFETIPLAERFVGLYQPPYNMDIFDNSFVKFVDLLTGKIVFYSREKTVIPEKPEIPHISNYVEQKYHGGVAMFLGLTGPNASDIIIDCTSINRIFNLDGFYVDQFGDIDRGLKRGAILSLSKDRLENALDKLLSGDTILYL